MQQTHPDSSRKRGFGSCVSPCLTKALLLHHGGDEAQAWNITGAARSHTETREIVKMIKCIMEDGRVRYFAQHAVQGIDLIDDEQMVLFYRRPNGELDTPRIREFMILETGVWVK